MLEASENRGTDLELRRRSLEGELERTRLCLAEREAEVQSLQDRAHSLQDHLKESEDREATLQREVQRLSFALSRAQDGERQLQEKSQGLSQALGDAAAGRGNLQDDVNKLQGALTAAEQDRRVLQVTDTLRNLLSAKLIIWRDNAYLEMVPVIMGQVWVCIHLFHLECWQVS